MMKKLVRIAVVMTMIPAAVVGVAGPAKAWVYCNPYLESNQVYIFDNQGYCGVKLSLSPRDVGVCRSLEPNWSDWAASAANELLSRKVTFYNNGNCSGENFSLPAGTSHPNFYSTSVGINGMGNEVSSYQISNA